jgi:CYTH domain-containing protein
MAMEIERKFLVEGDAWRQGATGVRYRQGYLCTDKHRTVRVRTAGDKAFLTIKGLSQGASRAEYEYEIPSADADAMLDALCLRPLIEKTRYRIPADDLVWEIDEFEGDNAGLIVAEVELNSADQPVHLPPWVGKEVTDDPRYYNANLVRTPYSAWPDKR